MSPRVACERLAARDDDVRRRRRRPVSTESDTGRMRMSPSARRGRTRPATALSSTTTRSGSRRRAATHDRVRASLRGDDESGGRRVRRTPMPTTTCAARADRRRGRDADRARISDERSRRIRLSRPATYAAERRSTTSGMTRQMSRSRCAASTSHRLPTAAQDAECAQCGHTAIGNGWRSAHDLARERRAGRPRELDGDILARASLASPGTSTVLKSRVRAWSKSSPRRASFSTSTS